MRPASSLATARDDAIAQAVAGARAAFAAANPASRERYQAACQVLPGGNTRTVLFHAPFPLRIAGGAGCRIWDVDGHEYLDFLGDFTAGLLGHSDPTVGAAIRGALDAGISLGAHNLLEAELARAISERFGLDLVRFTNSGTEANLMALATATLATRRRKVLVFDGGYHGGVLSFAHGPAPVNVPHEFVLATYNDAAAAGRAFDAHGEELAAVLVEPVLGAGGCVPGEPAFLGVLRERSAHHGAVLVFDEVMTSRLGPAGRGAALGIRPDLTTLGKYLGGGLPFGAFGGNAELLGRYDPSRPDTVAHAGTFNNDVLTMAAGVAAITKVFTPAAAVALQQRGDALRERLNEVARRAGVGMQFTGVGSMLHAHFRAGPIRCAADVAAGDDRLTELLFFDLLARGAYLARRGMIALSLAIGAAECEVLVDGVTEFIAERGALLPAT